MGDALFKRLVSRVAASLAVLAGGRSVAGATVSADRIYPYVVPRGYPKAASDPDLGNGLHVVLVVDTGGGLVRNVTEAELARTGLSQEEARRRALANLDALMKSGTVHSQVFPSGPQGKPFILIGGHWAAATAILLPGLRQLASQALHTDALCASIPHRDALLIFPKSDRSFRNEMRAVVRSKESDGSKPLTFDLFELTERGPVAFTEAAP